jgi:hypothetical protein
MNIDDYFREAEQEIHVAVREGRHRLSVVIVKKRGPGRPRKDGAAPKKKKPVDVCVLRSSLERQLMTSSDQEQLGECIFALSGELFGGLHLWWVAAHVIASVTDEKGLEMYEWLRENAPQAVEVDNDGDAALILDSLTAEQITTILHLLDGGDVGTTGKRVPPPRVDPPESEERFHELFGEWKRRTIESLQELQDELRRMAGRRPMTDYTPRGEDFSEYQVNVEELARQMAKAQLPDDSDDDESDTVSSDDEDEVPTSTPEPGRPVLKSPAVHNSPVYNYMTPNVHTNVCHSPIVHVHVHVHQSPVNSPVRADDRPESSASPERPLTNREKVQALAELQKEMDNFRVMQQQKMLRQIRADPASATLYMKRGDKALKQFEEEINLRRIKISNA